MSDERDGVDRPGVGYWIALGLAVAALVAIVLWAAALGHAG